MKKTISKIEAIYNATLVHTDYGCTVADDIHHTIMRELGDASIMAVASLINYYSWDGRISAANRAWALSITEESAPIGTVIHAAHLNIMANQFRKNEQK